MGQMETFIMLNLQLKKKTKSMSYSRRAFFVPFFEGGMTM